MSSYERLRALASSGERSFINRSSGSVETGVLVKESDLRSVLDAFNFRQSRKEENVSPNGNAVEELAKQILLAGMTNPSVNRDATSTVLAECAWELAESFYAARPKP